MNNEDDNIQFEQMPDWGQAWKQESEQRIVDKEYDTLYDELLDKCNPSNYKGTSKFSFSNEIYARLREMGSGISNEKELRSLRDRAIDELGLHISTTKTFKRLQTFLDPDNYTQRQPYDKELVENAGWLYTQLLQNKDDIRALERIENLPLTASIYDEYEFQILGPEEYLLKYPNGEKVKTAIESIDQEAKKSMEEEREFYIKHSATAYLEQYPNGTFSDEANCFLHKSAIGYLKNYPNGRYKESAVASKQGEIALGIFAAIILGSLILLSILWE